MNPCHAPLAFGFSNLAMLGWLAAAAAPLVIHLWSRHRHREAPWAAMQFLLAALRKNARRLQLQQWLLLAIRTLIILLVVLAAAEPYGERLLASGGRGPMHHVLVLDGSYSMAYRDDDQTHFGRAKQMAAALVRDSAAADSFTVIHMAAPPRTVLQRSVVNHEAVAAEIEALAQSHSTADLPGTLGLVEEALHTEPHRQAEPARQAVIVFTDLQRRTWQLDDTQGQSTSSSPQAALAARFAALADRAPITVIDVARQEAPNLAMTQLATDDAYATPGREVRLQVTLQQFGGEPRRQTAVELVVDEVPVAEQTLDVSAGGAAAASFTHRFDSSGSHTVSVRTAGDALSVDDVRYLVVPVREEVRVLCVAGREGAARYVASALNPGPEGDSPLRPVVVSEGALADLELADFECVFFCNVAQLTAEEAQRLRRYAAEGGGIVFFLGDRVVPESYNAHLRPPSDLEPLLPARIVEPVNKPQFGLDPLDYRHPIVAPFRGRERAGLLTMPVACYFRLEAMPDRPGAEVAASLPDGDPFIVAAPLGRGRTVMVATAASLASVDPATGEPWTLWPTWPSFLPMVRELLAYAAEGRQAPWQQTVGSSLGGALPAATRPDQHAPRILRPDGRTDAAALNTAGSGVEWSYGDTDLSGIYTLRDEPRGVVQQFAVNVDPAESDLAKADPSSLPSELLVRSTWEDVDADGAGVSLSQTGWNQPLLVAAFALLLLEAVLAWRFGRGGL